MNRRFRKPTRLMKESYSDIDYSNVWDAYDIALEYNDGVDVVVEIDAKSVLDIGRCCHKT